MTIPLVGIFWLVLTSRGINLLSYAIPLAEAEIYGDCLTCPVGHYDAWEAAGHGAASLAPIDTEMRVVIASSEYEAWPRGRVVFEKGADRFVVYADRQVFSYAPLITARFNLPEATIFKTDSHYRLARRIGP
jgi:hypothetical protein